MLVKIVSTPYNQNKNLVDVEVLEGDHRLNVYPMWLGKVNQQWQGTEFNIGDIVEASEIKLDELEEYYLTYNE